MGNPSSTGCGTIELSRVGGCLSNAGTAPTRRLRLSVFVATPHHYERSEWWGLYLSVGNPLGCDLVTASQDREPPPAAFPCSSRRARFQALHQTPAIAMPTAG